MKYFSMVELLMLTLLCICYAEDSPIATRPWTTPAIAGRAKRFSCRDIWLVCPTQKEYFVVPVSWSWTDSTCKIEESILDTALYECDNSVMDLCKYEWVEEQNRCSVPIPILKEAIDELFHGACSLHDLCYLTLNADRDYCDKWFLDNMKQICSVRKSAQRHFCLTSAYDVYRAVSWFGRPYFRKAQKWAEDHCK